MVKNRSDLLALNRGRQIELDIAKVLAIFFMAIIHVGDSISTFDYSILNVGIIKDL